MSTARKSSVCWIISDGRVGNDKQSQALAYYLQKQFVLECRTFQVELKQPWEALAPRLRLFSQRAMPEDLLKALEVETPDLVIGCGRKAALVSCFLRKAGGGRTKTIQILNPYITARHFDVLISPLHDRLEAANKISTLGSLHQIDSASLGLAKRAWQHELEKLEEPRIAVLIGGSNQAYQIDRSYILQMKSCVDGIRRQYASFHNSSEVPAGTLMISTSRRTSPELIRCVEEIFADDQVFDFTKYTPNPYEGVLAWADAVVVSAESVNMISEALGTGKPVLSSPPSSDKSKFSHFHQSLLEGGSLLPFDAADADGVFAHHYDAMQEAEKAARKIEGMIGGGISAN